MLRLLVPPCLAAAMLTVPVLASAAATSTAPQDIGSTVVGSGDGAVDYWTPARMAGATDLSVLLLPGDGPAQHAT